MQKQTIAYNGQINTLAQAGHHFWASFASLLSLSSQAASWLNRALLAFPASPLALCRASCKAARYDVSVLCK